MSRATQAAQDRALELVALPHRVAAPDRRERGRFLVLGDPQAPLARLLAALDAQGVLGDDGRLRPEVGLVSVGDHFDFKLEPYSAAAVQAASRDGLAFLGWLAQHPPDQVFILGGNHDLSRVLELGYETEASWSRASEVAARIGKKPPPAALAQFRSEFPHLPTPGMVLADYASFSLAQRHLVEQLLLARRMRLALVAELVDGTQVLLTHAGVTRREVELLGLRPDASAAQVRSELDRLLEAALGAVEPAWRAGQRVPLSLHPVNVTGVSGEEGGGLLNHRPANPSWPDQNADWAWRAESPRRYQPSWLPRGLVQVAGHTGHAACRRELHTWARDTRDAAVSVRTLCAHDGGCWYREGLERPVAGAATVYLVDPEFSKVAPEEVEFLWLRSVGP